MSTPKLTQYSEMILERRLVSARGAISRHRLGPQMANDAAIVVELDRVIDRMLLHLSSHVYTHRVDRQDIEVPFSRSETAPSPTGLVPLYMTAVVPGAILTFALGSVWVFLATALFALAWVAVLAANPPREVMVSGRIRIHREQFNAFPDNQTVYPDSLGSPVMLAVMDEPSIYYEP